MAQCYVCITTLCNTTYLSIYLPTYLTVCPCFGSFGPGLSRLHAEPLFTAGLPRLGGLRV